jgi:hypothetical protein
VVVEFDAATIRARLYGEADAAPAWQATATTSHVGAGFFGPMSHVFAGTLYPIVQIKRLEYYPTLATPPADFSGDNWSLEQIMVQK